MKDKKIKILFHGFGSAPVVLRHLIDISQKKRPEIEWHVILPTMTHSYLMEDIAERKNILYVEKELPSRPLGLPLNHMNKYQGSLIEDLEAQKRSWFKRNGDSFYKRGQDYYKIYKDFMLKKGITHYLCCTIETPEMKIAMAAAKELGIDVAYAANLRTITGTMFSNSPYETLPSYAEVNAHSLEAAKEFVANFRSSPLPAYTPPSDVEISEKYQERLECFIQPLPKRLFQKIISAIKRPDLFEPEILRISFLNNLPFLRDIYWRMKSIYNDKLSDIKDADNLPEKYVLYPLQVTPESSINVPAPYYVDQLRIIDALRMAMPNDHVLVVKEHRSGVSTRSAKMINIMKNKPGVAYASYKVSAMDAISRASIITTVTGTMALEALALGKPTLVFGRGMCADIHGGVTEIGNLPVIMKQMIGKSITAYEAAQRLAPYFSCRHPFIVGSTNMPDEPILKRGNIQAFFDGYMKHIDRIAAER